MSRLVRAAALAMVVVMASAGAEFGDRESLRIEAAWARLSAEQRNVIDLVAKDIWETERQNRGLPYHEASQNKRNKIRAEAMRRLGFKPNSRLGVEV